MTLLSTDFNVISFLITAIAVLISMTLHEFGHAAMATYWGDDTAKRSGQLTLNPAAHINWIGFAMFLIIGFGILGQVPVNPSKMRSVRWGSFWTSFAGPLMNLALALGAALILRIITSSTEVGSVANMYFRGNMVPLGSDQGILLDGIGALCVALIFWNCLLFFFNLLPFFPLDGWRMVLALLPGYWLTRDRVPEVIRKNLRPISLFLQNPAFKWQDWAQLSQIALFILIMISFVAPQFNILSRLISQPTYTLFYQLLGL